MHRPFALVIVLLQLPAFIYPQAPPSPKKHFDGKTWWEHVKVVADDRMEGRETGSEGLRKAEAYVVEQLTKTGIQPAGTDGFYQPVKFISRQIVEKECSIALIRNGAVERASTEPLYLDITLPAGIPLFSTGAAIYGFAGLLAVLV